jgi:hypothetical protein
MFIISLFSSHWLRPPLECGTEEGAGFKKKKKKEGAGFIVSS